MNRKIIIYGYINKGYKGQSALVECDIRNGFPGFDIVGLPGATIKEARERIRCALRSCGFRFPQSRVLINLSPASQPKDSTMLDLAIAISIMLCKAASETEDPYQDSENIKIMLAGELTLDGRLLESPQSIGAIDAAFSSGCQVCMLPFPVQTSIEGIKVLDVRSLSQAFLECSSILRNGAALPSSVNQCSSEPIFSDIIGLEREKDIIAMAAAGFHSTLIFGPPGAGKTMLSTRMHLLLPKLDERQRDERSRIIGCADLTDNVQSRIRLLSHDCTQTQFISGRVSKQPGEGALAHNGTLVLDEIDKYTPKLLQTVKDAYDRGYTQSTRTGEVIEYPSRFLMVGNMNPCSCGALGVPQAICSCTAQKLENHWKKIGRPLLERFDVRLPISYGKDLFSQAQDFSKTDDFYLEKVAQSAERQKVRYKYIEDVYYNGQIHLSTKALLLLKNEIQLFTRINSQTGLSSRDQIGCIALARSIADYEDCDEVTEEHFEKAKELRQYGLGDYYWRSLL